MLRCACSIKSIATKFVLFSTSELKMKYKIVLEEEKDGGFSVYVPELPGCASQGETRGQALANIKKAIKLYVWSIKEDKNQLARRKISIKEIAA